MCCRYCSSNDLEMCPGEKNISNELLQSCHRKFLILFLEYSELRVVGKTQVVGNISCIGAWWRSLLCTGNLEGEAGVI